MVVYDRTINNAEDLFLGHLGDRPDNVQFVDDYTRTDASHFQLNIDRSEPFVLGFANAYNTHFVAEVYKNGSLVETVHPERLYGTINQYNITSTGNLTIRVSYTPQSLVNTGMLISPVLYIACAAMVTMIWWLPRLRKR